MAFWILTTGYLGFFVVFYPGESFEMFSSPTMFRFRPFSLQVALTSRSNVVRDILRRCALERLAIRRALWAV